MSAKVPLRSDFNATKLRRIAKTCKDSRQVRRLLSLAHIYDGMNRSEAARFGGMDRQTLCEWAHRFNSGGVEGLKNRAGSGKTSRLNTKQLDQLAEIVKRGPDLEKDGVVRWRRIDLQAVIKTLFGVNYHERYVGSLLHKMGFSHVSARPQHPRQDPQAIVEFKKKFTETLKEATKAVAPTTPIEIWFQDEMRIGQKNGITRQWACKGTRPRQPAHQGYASAYVFGAICPERGTGAALIRPYCDTPAMQAHLEEISLNVAKGSHAVVLMDRAGWHTTRKLQIPKNISIVCLPPRSPELNPAENVWQYMRQNWLSNRIFEDYDAIVDAACEAWNKLIARPDIITSIGKRDWAVVT